jgi:hypothetical protein
VVGRRRSGWVVALLLAAASVALAGGGPAITSTSLGGVKVGLTKAAYKRILGKPYRVDYLENDYSRLVFTKRKMDVYFHGKRDFGVVVGTWNLRNKTAEGIGPCSTVRSLKAAYGSRLRRVFEGTSAVGYRLGALVFAVPFGTRVLSVSLKSPGAPLFVALATAGTGPGCS